MNNQLDAALANTLTKATESISAGLNFVQAQIPDVAQQLLNWKLASSCVAIVACLCLLVCYAFFLKWAFKKGDEDDWLEITIPAGIIGAIGALGALVVMLVKIFTITQIIFAPKIYLIEYAASIISR